MRIYDKLIRFKLRGIYSGKFGTDGNWSQDRLQWLLTAHGLLYAVFVLEMIVGYLAESAPQAAMVMGLSTGIFPVIWGVLLKA